MDRRISGRRESNPKVSLIIVNWNSKPYLPGCIRSILNSDYRNVEILVVDNDSKDGSADMVRKTFPATRFPKVRLVASKVNLGYCGGNNLGISMSKGQIIATLNPDIEFRPDCISKIVAAFKENPGVGVISPKALRLLDKNRIDSTGTILFPNFFATARGAGEFDRGQYDEKTVVFGAIGAYAFYRRHVLDAVALKDASGKFEYFDDDFFTSFDEHDLQLRIHLAGWTGLFVPKAVVYHLWRYSVKHKLESTGQLYGRAFRNYYLSLAKLMSMKMFIRGLPSIFLHEASLIGLSIIEFKPIFITTKTQAFPKISKMLAKRRTTREIQRMSDSDLRKAMSGNLAYLGFIWSVLASEISGLKLASVH